MQSNVSIIIPFYKGDSYFERLIVSIYNAIELVNKKFVFQLIVIIDSQETNIEFVDVVVNNYFIEFTNVEVVVIKNNVNLGVAKSRNLGLSVATGELFHLIDQDDTISPYFYSSILPQFDTYNFVLVNGTVHYENKKYNNHKLYYLKQKLTIMDLVRSDFIRSPGQVIFSKELILDFNFPEPRKYKGADDRFFWFKMFFNNKNVIKAIYLHEVLYNAFIHNHNYSSDQINLRKSTLENWDIFLKENELNKKLLKSINNDILSLKFSANIKQTRIDNLAGFFYRVIYFLDANKVIRYIFKRLIFSSH